MIWAVSERLGNAKIEGWDLLLTRKLLEFSFLLGNPGTRRINCANCFREKYLITTSKYFPLGCVRAFLVKTEGRNRSVSEIVAF